MSRIRVADSAGFCFGVKRAVEMAFGSAKLRKTATFGEIIHNPHTVRELEALGVRVIDSPYDAAEDETVIIRSHGTGKDTYRIFDEHGISYIDGTCPFVKRIHRIAAEHSAAGLFIIAGDKDHPEVRGIAGNCVTPPLIAADAAELEEMLSDPHTAERVTAAAAQTTYNVDMWKDFSAAVKRYCPSAEIFDTICSATQERQREAAGLAAASDMMLVIGGSHSSNTRKLYDICRNICAETFLIEDASGLETIGMLRGFSDICDISVGITAGASTPAYIIKEVYNQMSEKLQNMDEEFNFEEAIDASFKRLYTGNRVKGIVTAVNNTEAIVDVGTKQTGYVSLDELTDDPSLKPADVVKVGDELEFWVIKVNDADGVVSLSKKKIDAMKGFDTILKAKEEDTVLEGIVKKVVKGGVLVSVTGTNVFIPASQATLRRDDKLEDLVNKTVRFKVIEVNEQRGKAVGSVKNVLTAEREAARNKFWDSVQIGDKFKGEVKSITSYGAFVDLGGIDGMVHISELSWNRIKHPSEVVSVGDMLEVYVKDLDRDADRISLGYKKDEDNPFTKFVNEYKVDDVVKAKVVSITPFGAFAQIIPGIDGLIHISQIADKRVTNIKDVLSIGDEVEAKITEIDEAKKRISLSIRKLLEERGVSSDAEETEEASE